MLTDLDATEYARLEAERTVKFLGLEGVAAEAFMEGAINGIGTLMQHLREKRVFKPCVISDGDGGEMTRWQA